MKVKYPNCVFLTRLLYRISVLKSIAITALSVTICSFYECIEDYPCGSAYIISTLKSLLVLLKYLKTFYGVLHWG